MNPWNKSGRWLGDNSASCTWLFTPSPTLKILPPHWPLLKRRLLHVNVLLTTLQQRELAEDFKTHVGTPRIMVHPPTIRPQASMFEVLCTYPLCVAMTAGIPSPG